jgi:transposase
MPHIQAPTREQLGLPNLEEFIKKDNVVRVIDAFVDSLDLQAMGFERVIAKREGRPCFHPSLMLKLYLYGYLNGIRSSRKLERECKTGCYKAYFPPTIPFQIFVKIIPYL